MEDSAPMRTHKKLRCVRIGWMGRNRVKSVTAIRMPLLARTPRHACTAGEFTPVTRIYSNQSWDQYLTVGRGALAIVCRGDLGNLINMETSSILANSVLVAEDLLVREALLLAKRSGFNRVVIDNDSKILTQAIKSKTITVEAYSILQDIWRLQSQILECGFSWIQWKEINWLMR
ncbi:hypothetical protein PIB30_015100 [Stylosanthes scabra]|uniref:RNase H type-1 domain-containing protein n=1 Tax=Stylosanthes scabra TaxID=79078 RepID=A0ABU6R775_9FABA|nr:hypothetical protein [Stylosanthes scabra]